MSEEQILSRINEAGNQVMRIGNLWNEANLLASQGNFPGWNGKMERVWSELSADATKEKAGDEKSQKEQYEEINKQLTTLKINLALSSLPKSKQPSFLAKLRDLQYKALMEKDEFLRTLQNTQGKGTLYKDEFEDDFE